MCTALMQQRQLRASNSLFRRTSGIDVAQLAIAGKERNQDAQRSKQAKAGPWDLVAPLTHLEELMMSDKKRQKKDGRDKNKKNQAMIEHQPRKSMTGEEKDNHAAKKRLAK